MKLVTAIVHKEDSREVNKALVAAGFVVTKLSTTGGFLLAQNVTMLIGTEDDKVDTCIGILADKCSQRKELVPGGSGYEGTLGGVVPEPLEVIVGGATVFVTNVERFEKL